MKISALIVDDEVEVAETISLFLEKYGKDIEIIGNASNIKDALKIYKVASPDIVFLDIQLQNETGFDFIKKINNPDQTIVMITAHSEHALKAYEKNVNAYLTKPISPSRFEETIERVTNFIKLQKKPTNKLIIKDSNKENHIIETSAIIKIKSIGKGISEIYLDNDSIINCNKSIGKIEEKLDNKVFFRINWGIVINTNFVSKINLAKNTILLKDNSEEGVSVRRKKEFKEFITKK
jgi:two-component system LytT family response regulator